MTQTKSEFKNGQDCVSPDTHMLIKYVDTLVNVDETGCPAK